ncbi:EAL domain-containing protein [Eubacterium sp.]|uniref:EAL domain-containing protein n=1 Tax=Eubacterium sp. TaxID=142586 RepID=UPI00258E3759|nr:EAL domain-containing protein [Eubacterium sp.]MCR5367063.1 EAL domain-containing protein [Eubacterium sp.]
MFGYVASLSILALAVIICIMRSYGKNKKIAKTVRVILYALLLPVATNFVMAISINKQTHEILNIVCFMSVDVLLYFLMKYAYEYSDYSFKKIKYLCMLVLAGDMVSLAFNPFKHHTFTLLKVVYNDKVKYAVISEWYNFVHLSISFVFIVALLVVFAIKMAHVSKLYFEKYLVIELALGFVAIWEFYSVLLDELYDRSIIGYEIAGILIYFFSIEYNHVLLSHQMFDKLVTNVSAPTFFFDDSHNCIYMNPVGMEMFNIDKDDFEKPKKVILDFLEKNNKIDSDGFQIKIPIVKEDGEHIFQTEYKKLYDKKNELIGSYIIFSDVTDDEKKAEFERYRADHDSLTGLYNDSALKRKIEERLREDPDTEYYIVTSNIKEFKIINDVFGRASGDALLKQCAEILSKISVNDEIFGRIGADKFGLLVRKELFDEELFLKSSKDMVKIPENEDYPLIIQIGVYEVVDRNMPVSAMFDRAYMAMSSIKDDVNIRISYYENEMREDLVWEQKILGELEDAIKEKHLLPYLQPQVDVDGKIEGAEVLVRWRHPQEGLRMPGKFINVLEKNGKIVNLDMYIWEEACIILKSWKERGFDNMYLSVNISPKDFYYVDLYEVFMKLIEKYELDAKNLRLEITESVVMNDIEQKLLVINKLRSAGFLIEMDDFGSGYSSLNLLKDLPVDILKLDMVFLKETRNPERAKIILQEIINMARKLIIPVISEGVETEEQVSFLSDMGCGMFQGYYFAKPISLEEFEEKYLVKNE